MIYPIFVFGILLFLFLVLIWKAGKTFPVIYLFFFTFFLQYFFSTFLIYTQYKELKSQMPITMESLFEYMVPALSFLFLGAFIFNKDINISGSLKRIDPSQAKRLGYLLLFISYFFDVLKLFEFQFKRRWYI